MTLLADLERAVGAANLIVDPTALRTYETDGLATHRAVPLAVVLPTDTSQVAAAVAVCARLSVPFVARGAGTGLSGGAVPVAEGIVIGLSRMRSILEVDVPNRRVACTPSAQLSAGPAGVTYDIPIVAGFARTLTATATASSNATETNAANNIAVTSPVQVRLRPISRQNLPPKLP